MYETLWYSMRVMKISTWAGLCNISCLEGSKNDASPLNIFHFERMKCYMQKSELMGDPSPEWTSLQRTAGSPVTRNCNTSFISLFRLCQFGCNSVYCFFVPFTINFYMLERKAELIFFLLYQHVPFIVLLCKFSYNSLYIDQYYTLAEDFFEASWEMYCLWM